MIEPTAFGVAGVFLLMFVLFASGTIFWIWMLVDVLKRKEFEDKLVWVIVIVFLHLIGAILYYFVVYRNKR